MNYVLKRLLLLLLLQYSALVMASTDKLPAPIAGFCQLAFAGKIARQGQAFNNTATLRPGIPQRRIIAYLIGKHVAYLWYEHGGQHYHQHLVKFSTSMPYEVKASYVFDTTSHKQIRQLLKDRRFLSSHLSNQCGL